jgi:hypothetical protein
MSVALKLRMKTFHTFDSDIALPTISGNEYEGDALSSRCICSRVKVGIACGRADGRSVCPGSRTYSI